MFVLRRQRTDNIVHLYEKAVQTYENHQQVNDLLRMMSAKEITSNSSVTTTLLDKFYGEMVCT